MAFPTTDALQVVWVKLANRAASTKRMCQELIDASLAGPVSASAVEQLFVGLGDFRTYANSVAATPGLAAYVQAQYNDPLLDIATEYNTMIAQIESALAWMVANIPTSGGYVILDQWAADGTVTRRTFTTAGLSGLRTILNSVIATIG